MSWTMPFRRFLLLALLAASAVVQSPAAAQTTMPPGVARPLPQRPQVQPSPGQVANQNRRKRESLTPAQRLARDFERGGVNAAYLGVMAHALDRALAGEAPASDLDRAVSARVAAATAPERARLRAMVDAYRTVPVEARVRAMPRDVATLARGQAVSLEDARRLTAARPGAAGVLSGGPPRPGPAGAPGEMMRAPTMLREVDASTPRLASVGARVNGTERWVVLTGHFPGSSPIAVVYVRPLDGQSLAEAGQQTVDGQPVNVVLARVNATRSRIEGALPVGLAPGRYRVSARIPQGQREPVTNGRTLELAAYAYSLRITRIRCVDESDPEAIREQISGYEVGALTDEIRFSWATFADGGLTDMGMSQQYEGFDDYTHKPVRVHPSDDGALFMRVDGQPTPGVVANRLFAVLQMWEVDDAGFEVMRDGRFPAELGLASLDDVDVDQFLERLSQSLYWSMAAFEGSHERIGERRLSWSAGELQQMTDNPGRRHEGEIRFENDDATGTYLLHYEIRRVDAPR